MTPELAKKLHEAYPLLFRDRREGQRFLTLEVGDGWYQLIDALCSLIYWPYHRAQRDYDQLRQSEGEEATDGVVGAIDVERARLKVKEEADAVPEAVQVRQKYGTLRFHVLGASDAVEHYIEFAEFFSASTCEECGCPGRLREDGWLMTLCDEHASKR